MPTATRAVTALANVLQVAEAEMRAAQSARTLVEAHAHAETAVNLLVGEFGRWYGDQDGDGNRHVPFDTRGALPGELNPQGGGADGGAPPPSNAGLVLLAAGTTVNSPALTALLGDVGLWRAQPRRGYDDIASAVAAGSPDGAGLTGNVPRAVAAGRLVILARSMPEVDAFAASGLDALAQALQAAQAMQ